MDFLKKQLDTIQQNLAGLNATQKMLTASLVAIMVLTLVFWGRYAGTAEMEPVLNQTLSEEDIARMSASLDARGIPNKVVGGKLLVAADRKMQALAELGYQQLLPRNSKSGFDQMLEKLNPFTSPAEREAVFNRGREMTLGQIIGGFPNVAGADVMIDATHQRRIGPGGDVTPSATINIRTRSGSADKKLVNAAADLVTGAVSTMNRARIKVVVDGRAHAVQDGENSFDGNGGNLLESKQAWETSEAHKIETQLGWIDGVRATVTGAINTETLAMRSKIFDPKGAVVQPRMTETNNTESTSSAPPAAEPGVGANIGASFPTGGSPNTMTTQTIEKVQNQVDVSVTETTTSRPAGAFTAQHASVRLPRSYFVSVLKHQAKGKEPTAAEVAAAIEAQLPLVRSEVRMITGIKNDQDIFVDTYYEVSPIAAAAAGVASTGGGITAMVGGWGKEIAVGALAVISLLMVSTMVRRSSPVPVMLAAPESQAPSTLEAAEAVAGMASDGNATLAGMELDEDAIQSQQILDQVSTLVGEDPDAAANLVKRWLNRT